MESDIKLIMADHWARVFTSFYIDAQSHFGKFDNGDVTIGDVTAWSKDWLKANIKFTKLEDEDAA